MTPEEKEPKSYLTIYREGRKADETLTCPGYLFEGAPKEEDGCNHTCGTCWSTKTTKY